MTKEKFIDMYKKQQEFFKDRLSANHRMMDLEISIIQEEVIKSNAKQDKPRKDLIPETSSKDLKIRMLNNLLKQNKLGQNQYDSQIENSLELAKQYYQVLTDPEKMVEDYNKANMYEKDIKIGIKKGKR